MDGHKETVRTISGRPEGNSTEESVDGQKETVQSNQWTARRKQYRAISGQHVVISFSIK